MFQFARFAAFTAAMSSIVCGTRFVDSFANACPFCSSTAQTLRQDMQSMDVVALAEIAEPSDSEIGGMGSFRLTKIWRGEKLVGDKRTVEAPYFGPGKSEKKFLMLGGGTEEILWSSPLPVSPTTETYLEEVSKLVDDSSTRLKFYLKYLEHQESMLARDAYEEFAQSPYEEVKQIKSDMNRAQLLDWVKDVNVAPDRKRLYFTLLGVCGVQEDTKMLEELLRTEKTDGRPGLDACIGCYLTLKGESGLPLINELFLTNEKCAFADTYAAVMALRFHGTDGGVIDRERIVESMRLILERAEFADLVIPDLARWEDWSQVERITKLFIDANPETSWVRVPAVNYLRACPLPLAKEKLIELEAIDPKAVKRAAVFFPIPVPNSQPSTPQNNDSSMTPLPEAMRDVIRLPLGARSHQLASSNPYQLSDKSLVLAGRPVAQVNQPVLMLVMALSLLTLGLAMWLIVNGGRQSSSLQNKPVRSPNC
jgi:hypothetical protein